MNNFERMQQAQLRLTVLQLLAAVPGYGANEHIIRGGLADLKITTGRDLLRTQLSWLAEQGLVTVATVADVLQVATITQRGADVAAGAVLSPGVARPGPEGY